jgi:hypothetical protein
VPFHNQHLALLREEDRRCSSHHWVGILANIKAVVETGNVPLATRLKHGLMSTFMFMAPKETLRENVKDLKETDK